MSKDSNNYNDYIFKNGKFIGNFEEMYRNVDNPWNMDNPYQLKYEIILFILQRYNIQPENILDIGCEKGIFTSRLRGAYPESSIIGVDISQTAIKNARSNYQDLKISWLTTDIQKDKSIFKENAFDLILISDVLWYVLPDLQDILLNIKSSLRVNGMLIIAQSFYPAGHQQYGTDYFINPEELIEKIPLKLIASIETGQNARLGDYHCSLLFKKESIQ